MGSVKTISIIVAANIKGLEVGLGKANKSIGQFASNAARMGSILSFGVTAPLTALGKSAFDTFAQFENGMTKVMAVTGASADEMKLLTDEAKRLGATTQFTASQVADLQLVLGRKGFDPSAIVNMEESILDLALATGENLSLAAETVASSINAFNLESQDAARVANTLASAAANSSIQLSTFATAFGHAGASANAVGIDLEELSAMMGVLMDNGIKASKAGTGLRKIFMKLSKDGTDFKDVLHLATQGEVGLQKAMKMVGVTAANQLLILAKNKDKVAELTKEYKTNKTRLSEMAKLMGGTAVAKVKVMQSAIEGLKIEFGAVLADYLFPIIDTVKDLANNFANLDKRTKNMIITFGGIMAVAGPVLLGFGALLSLVNPLALAVVGLAAAFTALSVEQQDHRTELEKEQDELNTLVSLVVSATDRTDERATAIQNLQDKYPNFLKNLNAETVSNDDLKTALKEANDEYFRKIQLQRENTKLTDLQNKKLDAANKLYDEQREATLAVNKIAGNSFNELFTPLERVKTLIDEIKVTRGRGGMFSQNIKSATLFGEEIDKNLVVKLFKLEDSLSDSQVAFNDADSDLVQYEQSLKELGLTLDDVLGKDKKPKVKLGGDGGEEIVPKTPEKPLFSWLDPGVMEQFVKDFRKGYDEVEKIAQQRADNIRNTWMGVMGSFSQGFSDLFSKQTESVTVMVDGFEQIEERTLSFQEKFSDFVVNFLKEIGRMIIKAAMLAALMTFIMPKKLGGGGDFLGNFKKLIEGGFFADGGRPPIGKTSIVGERGPELFVPDSAGTIIPNHALGGGTVIPDVRISGDDLLIVFDRASRRKNRR